MEAIQIQMAFGFLYTRYFIQTIKSNYKLLVGFNIILDFCKNSEDKEGVPSAWDSMLCKGHFLNATFPVHFCKETVSNFLQLKHKTF